MRAGWQELRLDQLAAVGAGNPAPQGDKKFVGGTVPFYRTSDVGRVHVGELNTAEDKLNELGGRGLKLHPAGTVLLPKSGASTFIDHRVILTRPGYVSSHLATIKADERRATSRFLFYALQAISARDVADDASYPTLNLEQVRSITVPAPPLPEQQRIVAILDQAFEAIAIAAVNVEKNLTNIRQMGAAHLKSTLASSIGEWLEVALAKLATVESGVGFPIALQGMKGSYILFSRLEI